MAQNTVVVALLLGSMALGVLLLHREGMTPLTAASDCGTCLGTGRIGWSETGRLPTHCPECGHANPNVSDELDRPARWR